MADANPYESPRASDDAEATDSPVDSVESDDDEPWQEWITTDTIFARLFAINIDYALCFVFAVLVAKQVGNDQPVLQALLFYGIMIGYFFLFEALWARTPGKFCTGLIVIDMEGRPAGWRASLTRNFWRLLEANPILLGALPAGISVIGSKMHQRIGDRLAQTLVVPKRRL